MKYASIGVEREKIAPIKSLTLTFDRSSLEQFEMFLTEVRERTEPGSYMHSYSVTVSNNIRAVKGY